jgi:predicted Zn-dependent peptidase
MFEVIDKYNKVTKDDIIQVAKKYFNKNNRNVVTLIPEKEGAD